jgi:hypothetical protein
VGHRVRVFYVAMRTSSGRSQNPIDYGTRLQKGELDGAHMQTRAGWALLAALAMVATAVLPGVGLAAATVSTEVQHLGATPMVGSTLYYSYNWAGYFAQNTSPVVNNTVTKVSGTWVQPAVNCAGNATALTAVWVGIDGATDTTVEQTGSIAQCVGGVASYYVWWELYPLNAVQPIKTITVHAGDTITASVTYKAVSGKFAMTVADGSASFTKNAAQSGTLRASAECIVERPSGNHGLFSLAKFTTATFSSCTATISGHSGSITSFGQVGKINMVNNADTKVIAVTSNAKAKTGSFTVTWKGYH